MKLSKLVKIRSSVVSQRKMVYVAQLLDSFIAGWYRNESIPGGPGLINANNQYGGLEDGQVSNQQMRQAKGLIL